MRLAEIFLGHRVADLETIREALRDQRASGGRLGDALVRLGAVDEDQLAKVLADVEAVTPRQPRNLAEVGVDEIRLTGLMLKFMAVESRESTSDIAKGMGLPSKIVEELLNNAVRRKLVQPVSAPSVGLIRNVRYGLSDEGRIQAADALRQNRYLGPAPVPLSAFQAQISRQKLDETGVTEARLREGLADLVTPEHLIRKLLLAVSAARSLLLFGPTGNGKSTIAGRIAGLFEEVIYVPHAVEIAGQIMKVFDAGLHRPVISDEDRQGLEDADLGGESFDDRWVACRRPFAMAGGELTLEMLDMQYDPETGFYDAPLHVKALNGVFLIDDFGRQRCTPDSILNRWIVPMEGRQDYLHLHTGKSFSVPFDEILVFSTNIDPQRLMDEAQLRRIPYKILLPGPGREAYHQLFHNAAQVHGLKVTDEVIGQLIDALTVSGDYGLAYFQPEFVCDQIARICRRYDAPAVVSRELALEALSNLYVQIERQAAAAEAAGG